MLGLRWAPNPRGDIHGFNTRDGATEDGGRGVRVTTNTDSLVPAPGTPPTAEDQANDLVDHALLGR